MHKVAGLRAYVLHKVAGLRAIVLHKVAVHSCTLVKEWAFSDGLLFCFLM